MIFFFLNHVAYCNIKQHLTFIFHLNYILIRNLKWSRSSYAVTWSYMIRFYALCGSYCFRTRRYKLYLILVLTRGFDRIFSGWNPFMYAWDCLGDICDDRLCVLIRYMGIHILVLAQWSILSASSSLLTVDNSVHICIHILRCTKQHVRSQML